MPTGWGYAIGKIFEVLNHPVEYLFEDPETKRQRSLERAQKRIDKAQEKVRNATEALKHIKEKFANEK